MSLDNEFLNVRNALNDAQAAYRVKDRERLKAKLRDLVMAASTLSRLVHTAKL